MFKVVAIGVTALFVTASPAAHAQTAANAATPSASDLNGLTDLRIDVVKAALKLTPDQEKYWPSKNTGRPSKTRFGPEPKIGRLASQKLKSE